MLSNSPRYEPLDSSFRECQHLSDLLYFYIAKEHFPEIIPETRADLYPNHLIGNYNWTLQTYLALRQINYPCELVSRIPEQGIVISHSINLPQDKIPSKDQLFVCIQADYARHPYAQVHIVQNPLGCKQKFMRPIDRIFQPGWDYYMRHWPQPKLIPRNSERGTKFQNICYFGLPENLSSEMQTDTFRNEIKKMNLVWKFMDRPTVWNDFSEVDVILAVRNFLPHQPQWKPATKLFNAWLAGVPAIVDQDSAYTQEQRGKYDFLRASSAEDVLRLLRDLQQDLGLRDKMVENCRLRAVELDTESMTKSWIKLIENKLVPHYQSWTRQASTRAYFTSMYKLRPTYQSIRKSVKSLRDVLPYK